MHGNVPRSCWWLWTLLLVWGCSTQQAYLRQGDAALQRYAFYEAYNAYTLASSPADMAMMERHFSLLIQTQKAVQEHPESAEAHYALATAYHHKWRFYYGRFGPEYRYGKGLWELARRTYEKAEALGFDPAQITQSLGTLYLEGEFYAGLNRPRFADFVQQKIEETWTGLEALRQAAQALGATEQTIRSLLPPLTPEAPLPPAEKLRRLRQGYYRAAATVYRLEREAERRLQAFNSLWQKTVQSLRQLEQLSAGEHTRKEAGNRYQQVVQMLGISAETRLLDPSTCPDERQVQIGAYRLANGQEIPSHTRCLLTGSEWKEVQALLQQTRAIAELRTF